VVSSCSDLGSWSMAMNGGGRMERWIVSPSLKAVVMWQIWGKCRGGRTKRQCRRTASAKILIAVALPLHCHIAAVSRLQLQ
jgi:hypothetical protein